MAHPVALTTVGAGLTGVTGAAGCGSVLWMAPEILLAGKYTPGVPLKGACPIVTDNHLGLHDAALVDWRSAYGTYAEATTIGAIIFAILSRRANPRLILIGASLLVGIGYTLFLPFHLELWQVLLNLMVAGLGSGALVGALPAAAAALLLLLLPGRS